MVSLNDEIIFSFEELKLNLLENPYPFYEELLSYDKPVYGIDQNYDRKILLLTRFNDISHLLGNSEDISSNPKLLSPNEKKGFGDLFILNTDGDDHVQLRKILLKYFTKDVFSQIELFLKDLMPPLIASLKINNPVDLITNLAEIVPLSVVGMLMGITDLAKLKDIRKWTTELSFLMDDFINNQHFSYSAETIQSSKMMLIFSKSLVDEKSKNLSDDLVSHIIRECKKENLNEEIIVTNVLFMLVATQDTTVNMIANGIYLFLNHKTELNKLIENQELAKNATEEILRFESPKQRATYRLSKNEIVLERFNIPKHIQVMAFLGAANRDPRKFTNPNLFNISRNILPNLAFGHGIHNCLGKALARLEGEIVFPAISQYLANLKFHGNIYWRKNTLFRIPESLIVTAV